MTKFTPALLLLIIACRDGRVDPSPVIVKTDSITHNIDSTGHILRGTTILEGSNRNMDSHYSYGLSLADFKASDCQEPMTETPPPTIINSIKQPDDSTLVISASVNENCAHDFLGEIEVIDSSTINLVHHGYGGFASCNCCFGLTYTINLMDNEEFDLKKLQFVTINGIVKTKLPRIKGNKRRSYY